MALTLDSNVGRTHTRSTRRRATEASPKRPEESGVRRMESLQVATESGRSKHRCLVLFDFDGGFI